MDHPEYLEDDFHTEDYFKWPAGHSDYPDLSNLEVDESESSFDENDENDLDENDEANANMYARGEDEDAR